MLVPQVINYESEFRSLVWRFSRLWVRLLILSGLLWRKRLAGWSGFARVLRKPDREAFDELMDACRSYASESSKATNPIVFEPIVMSIIPS